MCRIFIGSPLGEAVQHVKHPLPVEQGGQETAHGEDSKSKKAFQHSFKWRRKQKLTWWRWSTASCQPSWRPSRCPCRTLPPARSPKTSCENIFKTPQGIKPTMKPQMKQMEPTIMRSSPSKLWKSCYLLVQSLTKMTLPGICHHRAPRRRARWPLWKAQWRFALTGSPAPGRSTSTWPNWWRSIWWWWQWRWWCTCCGWACPSAWQCLPPQGGAVPSHNCHLGRSSLTTHRSINDLWYFSSILLTVFFILISFVQ